MTERARIGAVELSLDDADAAPRAPLDISGLYRDFYATLCIFIRRRFGAGPPDPEDIVQMAFAQLAAHPEPETIDNPKGYLYRTAHTFVLYHRRHAKVNARNLADFQALNSRLSPADSDPARIIEGRSSLAAVQTAIEALDERRRNILIMHSLEGVSCAEIGRRLGLSASRVIQLYGDAIAACAAALRDDDAEPVDPL